MYERQKKGWAKHWDFILLDIICLELAFVLAYFVKTHSFGFLDSQINRAFFIIGPFVNFSILLTFSAFAGVLKRGMWAEFIKTLRHVLLYFAICALVLFSMKLSSNASRLVTYYYIAIYFVLSFISRLLLKNYLWKNKGKVVKKSLIILTSADKVQGLLDKIERNNYQGYTISAIALKGYEDEDSSIRGIPIIRTKDEILEYCLTNWVDEAFVELSFGDSLSIELINRLESMGISIHIASPIADEYGYKVIPETFAKIPVLTVTTNVMTALESAEKRILDIVGGIAGSLVTLVLVVILGPIIKIKSPGPIFFTQTRIGKNGKLFKVYKFRSMYMDAEERKKELMSQNRVKDGMMFKIEFDPRIIGNYIDEQGNQHTGIGEFIRRYSLDEFPQFFNVLFGDMSIVGTRPPTTEEYEKYSEHHKARLAIKPGITGLWQISGRSNITDFEEVVRLDTQYINSWTLGLDIKIILDTVKVVLKKEGSM